MFNNVTLIGYLGSDAESRATETIHFYRPLTCD